jgi:hypothetical protein
LESFFCWLVTNLRIFFCGWLATKKPRFAGLFEGGWRKSDGKTWWFAGEFVVRCMADVVFSHHVFWGRKIRQVLEVYFFKGGAESLTRPASGRCL